MKKDTFCVYKHTAPNGKTYVGITSINPQRRWNNGTGYSAQPLFYRAILKYGWENIEHEVVCSGLTQEEASSLEKELIAKYKSNDSRFGYNITSGGFGGATGYKNSDETRKKKSESAKVAWDRPSKHPKKLPVVNGVKQRKGYTGLGHKKTPIVQKTLDGEYVRTWNSMCEIEKTLGIPTGRMSECCHGKRLSTQGYKWSFAEVIA